MKKKKKIRVRCLWSRVARTKDACWGRMRQRVVRVDRSGHESPQGKLLPAGWAVGPSGWYQQAQVEDPASTVFQGGQKMCLEKSTPLAKN